MISEKSIIDRLKNGESKAMEDLLKIHKDYVYTIVIQMVKSSVVAEELTQDVFVKVFKKITLYEEKSKFSTWLYTIAYRTCLNYLEKKKIVFSMSEINNPDHKDNINTREIKEDQYITLQSQYEENERQKIVWNAIDAIPLQQGMVITLHYLQQFSVKEIAEMMKVPENTIKTHLFRGRSSIKEILQKHFSQEELL